MERLPPGQRWVPRAPVLHHGSVPEVGPMDWSFFIRGLTSGGSVEFSWEEFNNLPGRKVKTDFHCVTGWSVMDVEWAGVPFSEVSAIASPAPAARFVMVHCYGGYTTNLPLDALMSADVLFALSMGGSALTPEHGGPLRLVVPALYAWKSAKWVRGIEYMEKDRPGFWESRGYHNDGDPWQEQRYS